MHRVGIKWLLDDQVTDFELADLIPIYHKWIQQELLDGLLIDVADYSHVQDGPGLMIIAHEGDFSMEEYVSSQRGMLYLAKRTAKKMTLYETLTQVAYRGLKACHLLESNPYFQGNFCVNKFVCVANDRLRFKETKELSQSLSVFAENFFQTAVLVKTLGQDPRERPTFLVQASDEKQDLDALLTHCASM